MRARWYAARGGSPRNHAEASAWKQAGHPGQSGHRPAGTHLHGADRRRRVVVAGDHRRRQVQRLQLWGPSPLRHLALCQHVCHRCLNYRRQQLGQRLVPGVCRAGARGLGGDGGLGFCGGAHRAPRTACLAVAWTRPGSRLTRGVDAVVVEVRIGQLRSRHRQLGPSQRLVAGLAHASNLGGCRCRQGPGAGSVATRRRQAACACSTSGWGRQPGGAGDLPASWPSAVGRRAAP